VLLAAEEFKVDDKRAERLAQQVQQPPNLGDIRGGRHAPKLPDSRSALYLDLGSPWFAYLTILTFRGAT
jgi:hypothetical protein